MAQSAELEGAACPLCLEDLESGSGIISLAPCGHILHRACFQDCAAAAGQARCPMCRGRVAVDRIRTASAVPGARLAGGAGYAPYAPRSAVPLPPTAPAGGSLPDASGAPAATDIPAGARDALLGGILEQLGAASPASPPGPDAASTWCFSIDVSSSMGSSRDWQPGAVSRLCFALASLACVVEAKVAPGDWVTVQAFDADQATLKRWFRRPAAFDKAAFLGELTGAVRHCGLDRYGTATCAAVERAVETLAAQANSLAAEHQPGPAHQAATHSLVLLTDGQADDERQGFSAAAALLRDPPFAGGGFKALLLHIADHGGSSRCLARLAADGDAVPLQYVQVTRLQMGASLDLTPLPARVRRSAAAGGGTDRDWRSVRAFGDGVAGFVLSPLSSRPSRAAAQLPRRGPGSPTPPHYDPDAQVYSPTSPHYDPDARVYSPTSPHYDPDAPAY